MKRFLEHLLACGLLACAGACTGGLSHRSVAETAGELPLPVGIERVRVELQNGSLEVHPGAEGQVRYRGIVRRAADTEEQLQAIEAQGTELVGAAEVEVFAIRGPTRPPGGDAGVLGLELVLEVPPGLPLEIQIAGSGNLVAEDRQAGTVLDTSRGDVRCMRATGATRIHTGRGNVIVYDHRGDLDVNAATGDMQVFVHEPGGRLRLVTGQGNVQCLVPPSTSFRVDARAQTGKLANGFGLPIQRDGYSASMVGQRGDGRTEIVLRTGKGHLSLSHKTFD